MLASVASINSSNDGFTIKKQNNIISIHNTLYGQEEFYREVKNPSLIISIGIYNNVDDNDKNNPICIILYATGILSIGIPILCQIKTQM